MDSLVQKIASLPAQPGVYLFKDERGELLYVGKAANLKHRVSSYFQKPAGKDLKTLAEDHVPDLVLLDGGRGQSGRGGCWNPTGVWKKSGRRRPKNYSASPG